MKTIIATLLIFIVQVCIFAQPKITREVTKLWDDDLQDWKNLSEKIYQYNSDKELTLYQESTWSENENKFIGENKTTYDYFGYRTSINDYRAIYDGKLYWILNDSSEYLINEDGCKNQFNESFNFLAWRWDYEYLADCLIKSATHYFKDILTDTNDWQPNDRILYSYSNNNQNINYIVENYAGGDEWDLIYKGHEYYDNRGNLLEEYNSNEQPRLYENTYDSKDRLVFQTLYTSSDPDSALLFRRETEYKYFEDENGFLIKMLYSRRYANNNTYNYTFLYENYCDGLTKTEEYTTFIGVRKQWYYEYDEPTNCLESEEVMMQISPNPSSGSFTITSDLLFQNTEISIYSSNGQLIQSIPFVNRADIQKITFDNIPNGVYFVRLKSDEQSITAPFIIMK